MLSHVLISPLLHTYDLRHRFWLCWCCLPHGHIVQILHTHFTYGSSLIRLQLYIYSLVWTEYGNRSNFLFTMYNAYTSVDVVVAVLDSQLLLNFRHSYFPLRFRCFIHIIRSFNFISLSVCLVLTLSHSHPFPRSLVHSRILFFPLSIVFSIHFAVVVFFYYILYCVRLTRRFFSFWWLVWSANAHYIATQPNNNIETFFQLPFPCICIFWFVVFFSVRLPLFILQRIWLRNMFESQNTNQIIPMKINSNTHTNTQSIVKQHFLLHVRIVYRIHIMMT